MSIPAPLENLLAKLSGVKPAGKDKWIAFCPIHENPPEGHKPSLSIKLSGDTVLVYCPVCGKEATPRIVEAVGLTMKDLFAPRPSGRPQASGDGQKPRASAKAKPKPKKSYATLDGAITEWERIVGGKYVWRRAYPSPYQFHVVRFNLPDTDPETGKPRKEFRPFHHNGKGWVCADAPGKLPLYRGDELPPDGPILVVEGELCADAGWGVDLPTVTSAHGCKSAGKSDWTALAGRGIIVSRDNDDAGRKYALEVAMILTALEPPAKVRIVELPGLSPKGDIVDWVGPDGPLDCKSPEDIREAILGFAEAAPMWVPPEETPADVGTATDGQSITGLGSVKWIADALLTQHRFARDAAGKLHAFTGGVYRAGGEKVIKRAVKRLLEQWELTDKWSTHRAAEVVEYIRVDPPELWPQPPVDVVNVGNGLLNVTTGELKPHDPSFLSPIQLSVNYDPAATCPAWERFVQQTFPADALAVAWQIVAWLMLPYTAIQRAILMLGEGANGKSTYLAGVIAFIGKGNVAALSLHKLEADRFSAARLVGKLANVCPDLPSAHLAGTSVFKALVGGDVLLGERKYADSFEFSPFARLIFSANHPPRSADASHAFFRRWIVIPFGRTFEPKDQIPRNVLDARLADPKELSGVLNKALAERPGLHANGFIESQSMRDAWNEFRQSTDPMAVWLDTSTVEGPDILIAKSEILLAFNADARHDQRPTVTGKAFGQAIKRLRPRIEEAQRTIAGKVVWVWLGIGLKTTAPDSLD